MNSLEFFDDIPLLIVRFIHADGTPEPVVSDEGFDNSVAVVVAAKSIVSVEPRAIMDFIVPSADTGFWELLDTLQEAGLLSSIVACLGGEGESMQRAIARSWCLITEDGEGGQAVARALRGGIEVGLMTSFFDIRNFTSSGGRLIHCFESDSLTVSPGLERFISDSPDVSARCIQIWAPTLREADDAMSGMAVLLPDDEPVQIELHVPEPISRFSVLLAKSLGQ